MEEKKYEYEGIGSFNAIGSTDSARKGDIVVQSFWTKPIASKEKLESILWITALSLHFAHRSGYKVHMHTDSKGYEMLKDFGYDKLVKTLDKIPNTVPAELFAAGKYYALKAEGTVGKVHIDNDVFLKAPGILNKFYVDKADAICQQEEDYEAMCFYQDQLKYMHILGYPITMRPDWRGSMNTGVIGFNNKTLANKFINNYFAALKIYTKDRFERVKKSDPSANITFDFILEQVTLSYMSIGYKVYALLPTKNACIVSDAIGYQHLQGSTKWKLRSMYVIKSILRMENSKLASIVEKAILENKA